MVLVASMVCMLLAQAPTATLSGTVVDRGNGRPIAGAEVHLYPRGGGTTRTARTDDRGRYTFACRPGPWTVSLFGVPPTHALPPGLNSTDIRVPAGGARVEVEPLDALAAAPPLRFAVRDEAGRPAARAAVAAQTSSRYAPRTADDRGEFAIPGLPPGEQASVEVRLGDRITDGPVHATAGRTEPVPVTIVPGLTVAIAGRVVGPGGAPIRDAALKVEARPKDASGHMIAPPVPLGDGYEVRTGPDGTFRTAQEIYRKGRELRVAATAEGFVPARTDWIAPGSADRLNIPDLVLRRATAPRPVAGRVVDRDGQGVPGASVFPSIGGYQRAETTDGQGRFRLGEVPGGTALVFAEKAGFRFGGAMVGPADAVVEIRLARAGEPTRPIAHPAPPLSRADERAMAREWLAPMVAEAREGSLGRLGQSVLPALARVDPDRVLEMIENRAVPPTPEVLSPVVLAQFERDPAEAIATIEADRDPAARAAGLLAIADAIPDIDRARRAEWVDRALAEARRVEGKDARLGLLGEIADRWLDLGRLDRARPILLEGRAIIAAMPRDQYTPAGEPFAEVLAAIDLATARPILEGRVMSNIGGDISNMVKGHLAGAAVRVAGTDPAEAERLVAMAFPNYLGGAPDILQVCRRMARADLPRARRILDNIRRLGRPDATSEPAARAAGLGLMALELADFDPEASRRLLDETFDRLRQVGAGGPPGTDEIPVVMAALLPLVERLEPDRLEERLWLAAAIHRPAWVPPNVQTLQPPVMLAMLVARYDRAMAAALIAPALESLPETLVDASGFFQGQTTIIKALAAYDPRAVAAVLAALPESCRKPPPRRDEWNAASLDTQVRLAAAEALGWPADRRWRRVLEGDALLQFFVQPR